MGDLLVVELMDEAHGDDFAHLRGDLFDRLRHDRGHLAGYGDVMRCRPRIGDPLRERHRAGLIPAFADRVDGIGAALLAAAAVAVNALIAGDGGDPAFKLAPRWVVAGEVHPDFEKSVLYEIFGVL